ncbi:CpaF family protein [Leekyejoonella antrihumi]|uniref:CpaF family protein n=1 Tax=Leekyejoonella antrihumi TaxID=1660198 RepID=A0A563DU59_9MICO|nr:CpaF family protein [Leekyejoonella antrihumi]TWP33716.1 CpaF family protein [Leekyejoonella antrihumi]
MSLSDRLEQARRGAQDPAGFARSGASRAGSHHASTDPLLLVKQRVHQALIDSLGPQLYDPHLRASELEQRVKVTLQDVLETEDTPLSTSDRTRVAQEVSDEILGHGPIEPFLRDTTVTEIMVNGPNQIYIERDGRVESVQATFSSEAHLRRTIEKIVSRVGRRIDEASPMVDARLLDGSRVNAVIAPVALDGSLLTIRKFAAEPFTDKDLIAFGTMTPQVRDFLEACVRGKISMVVSGGTGTGKTTFLNVMSGFIPEDERIITVEDAAELQLRQQHVLRMESRPPNIEGRGVISIRDLVRNALRMRPDRILVGEVRDGAALDMLQAMNTGHEGSLTTVHANSPRDSLSRLETMVLMAGIELPMRAIREQLSSAIDLIVQLERMKDGSRRVVALTEVLGMEGDIITLQDLFRFDYSAGRDTSGRMLGVVQPTGLRPKFTDTLAEVGVQLPLGAFNPALMKGAPAASPQANGHYARTGQPS